MLPSSSPIAINGERSSTSLPAQGFSTTASAAALRVGGVTGRPSSLHVSSTMVRNFRMFEALMLGSPLFIPLYLYCSPRDGAGPCGRRRHGADYAALIRWNQRTTGPASTTARRHAKYGAQRRTVRC